MTPNATAPYVPTTTTNTSITAPYAYGLSQLEFSFFFPHVCCHEGTMGDRPFVSYGNRNPSSTAPF